MSRRAGRNALQGVDQSSTRRFNLGLILRQLRDHGGSSRAQIAVATGLSKPTASTLVAELVGRGLVREGGTASDGSVGRPGTRLRVDGRRVCGIGVEINADYVSLVAVDLAGVEIDSAVRSLDVSALALPELTDVLIEFTTPILQRCARDRRFVGGLTIGAPGVIGNKGVTVRFAPNLGWRDLPLVEALEPRLPGIPVLLENDAKLGAIGEYAAAGKDRVDDLLYVTSDVGVGGGIISDGVLLRGAGGFAGELGHLPLDPQNRPCNCGRTGCWEKAVGLPAFLGLVGEGELVTDPQWSLPERLADLRSRADAGDRRVTDALDRVAEMLSTGISIAVDVLNPMQVVLGGYFGWFEPYLAPVIRKRLDDRRIGDIATAVEVTVSRTGLRAAATGGAHFALGAVFEDPTLVPFSDPAQASPTEESG